MSDADHVRAEINAALNKAESVMAAAQAYHEAVQQMQSAILLLDLHAPDSRSMQVIRGWAPMIGEQVQTDMSLTAAVQTELQAWLPNV